MPSGEIWAISAVLVCTRTNDHRRGRSCCHSPPCPSAALEGLLSRLGDAECTSGRLHGIALLPRKEYPAAAMLNTLVMLGNRAYRGRYRSSRWPPAQPTGRAAIGVTGQKLALARRGAARRARPDPPRAGGGRPREAGPPRTRRKRSSGCCRRPALRRGADSPRIRCPAVERGDKRGVRRRAGVEPFRSGPLDLLARRDVVSAARRHMRLHQGAGKASDGFEVVGRAVKKSPGRPIRRLRPGRNRDEHAPAGRALRHRARGH